MESFADVFAIYEVGEIAADCDVPYGTAKQWKRRGNIPAQYWPKIIAGAQRRHIKTVNAEMLAKLAASAKGVTAA